jgi:hypothetical protein
MTAFEWLAIAAVATAVAVLTYYFYRTTVDSLRLDALQAYNWQLGYIDGEFGVLAGSPPKMVGSLKPSVREAIDSAILERQANRGN